MGKPTDDEHNGVKQQQQAVSDARGDLDKLSEAKKAAADDVVDAHAEVLIAMGRLLYAGVQKSIGAKSYN